MSKKDVVEALLSSALFAQCNKCGGEFKLSDSLIFDGLEKFPDDALMLRMIWSFNLYLLGLL